jgi:hypothetical protein
VAVELADPEELGELLKRADYEKLLTSLGEE